MKNNAKSFHVILRIGIILMVFFIVFNANYTGVNIPQKNTIYYSETPLFLEKRYEHYTTGDDYFDSISDADYIGQIFTVGAVGTNEDFTLSKIKVKIYKYGDPTGDALFTVRNVNEAGLPTDDILSTGFIDTSMLTTNSSGRWYTIPMTPCILNKDMSYALVGNYMMNPPHSMIRWRYDSDDQEYPGGYGVWWHADQLWMIDYNASFMFEIWGVPLH